MNLSKSLIASAEMAEARAAALIKSGDPEAAEVSQRNADHYRRLAYNHSAAAKYQGKPELDPEQAIPPSEVDK
jgi:hypothetical protein